MASRLLYPAITVFALGAIATACQDRAREPASEVVSIDYEGIEAQLPPRPARGRTSDAFPNIKITDQQGETYRFFDDLVEDRAVLVNFMFTRCALICPGTTAHLVKLHRRLGDAVGRDIVFVSVSLDPEFDTPEVLRDYWQAFGGQPGWHYLTGNYEEIELLRRRMGVYDLDPVIDADKTQHSGIVTFGNDRIDRWAALPALSDLNDLEETVRRFAVPRVRKTPQRPTDASSQVHLEKRSRLYHGRGVVVEARAGPGEVVIEHEAIDGLMPAMTMVFAFDDPKRLDTLKRGETIVFSLVSKDPGFRIVEIDEDRLQPEGGSDWTPGARLYATYCSSCHGARGCGDGALSDTLDPRPALHCNAAAMDALSDAYLVDLLTRGGPALGRSELMGSWGEVLSAEQIREVVAFLRTLSK